MDLTDAVEIAARASFEDDLADCRRRGWDCTEWDDLADGTRHVLRERALPAVSALHAAGMLTMGGAA